MSGRGMTTQERAARQKVMMALRSWMAENGVSTSDVAETMDITVGHLRTLINANRTCSKEQVELAKQLMGGSLVPSAKPPKRVVSSSSTKKLPEETTPPATRKTTQLRPLTKAEGEFVASIAKAWLQEHKGCSREDFVTVVRELGIAIRS